MAQYIRLTLPKREAEALIREFDGLYCGVRDREHPEAAGLVARLKAAMGGGDLRRRNRFPKPPKAAPKPRVGLDLRRSA